jgi:mannose-6-phosphate isomerase-like protein (cupin superfamily)
MQHIRSIFRFIHVTYAADVKDGKEMNYIHKKAQSVEAFIAGDDTHIKELMHPKNENIQLPYSLALGSLEKGTSSIAHILENEELYYILDGQAIIYIEDDPVPINKGDSLLIMKGKEQYVKNIGEGKLSFLCIVSPAWEAAKEQIIANN